jgi:hypothetical protein
MQISTKKLTEVTQMIFKVAPAFMPGYNKVSSTQDFSPLKFYILDNTNYY